MKTGTTIAFLLVAVTAFAQHPRVNIPGSEIRKITSSIVAGQEYELQVLLPSGYKTGGKKYPVVYLMDSQWDFPLVSGIYGEQYYDGFIPELIIVGVTWGGPDPKPDSLRFRDYSPSKVNWAPHTGGAAAFLSFMKEELFPFVESQYRADNTKRALMGCSLGGLFTLYALFTEPGLFQHYIAASPAVEWNNEDIYLFEKAYYNKRSTAPARLYMTVGEVERSVPGFEKFATHLRNRRYNSIQLNTRVLDNTGHSGTKAETYARGLQYVYQRPSISLKNTLLIKYAGNYRSDNNAASITIKNENDQLFIFFGTNKYALLAASETDFYSTSEFLNVRFKMEQGNVDGFQLETYGHSQFMTKIN